MEKVFSELPWNLVPEKEVRHRVNIILGSLTDDVKHQGFEIRSSRELRHYNWRNIRPVFDGLFLVLNGKPMREGLSMMHLLDATMIIGCLEGLADDLLQGTVKLPMNGSENGQTSLSEVLKEYGEEKFHREKNKRFKEIAINISAITKLDIPGWQKLIFTAYLTEVLIKKSLTLNRSRVLTTVKK